MDAARSSSLARFALKPTRRVTFWRTFWPYQLLRFVVINLRMLRVIRRSHG